MCVGVSETVRVKSGATHVDCHRHERAASKAQKRKEKNQIKRSNEKRKPSQNKNKKHGECKGNKNNKECKALENVREKCDLGDIYVLYTCILPTGIYVGSF